MKLVLCSEGFHTQNTVNACAELVTKPAKEISVAIICEAYAVEPGDKRWVLHNLNCVADNFGEIDIVDLLALPIGEVERRIRQKDVLFVVGGHTDYLMHVFLKTGFTKLLPKLLKDKVYVGSSAGAMVAGRRIVTEEYRKEYGEKGNYDIDDYLCLVNLAIKPHMDSLEHPRNRTLQLRKACAGAGFPVYGLRDDSAIVVDGDEWRFIGSDPIKLSE